MATKTNRKTDPRRTPAHRAVSAYLKAMKKGDPLKRLEKIQERQVKLTEKKKKAVDPVSLLKITQEQVELHSATTAVKAAARRRERITSEFIEHAKAFSEENGISFSTWVRMGVPREVLEAAGVQKATQGRKKKTGS